MKKCKSGYYYCNTDKKCKPIPRGYRVGYGGYLRKEKDDDDSKNKSNGNGNGNGNGSNGNGNGGNGSGGNGNGGGMGESVTHESATAIPMVAGGISKIPATIGALSTVFNMVRKKRKLGNMEKRLYNRQKNTSQQTGSDTYDKSGLDTSRVDGVKDIKIKKGQAMQDSYVPRVNEGVISFKQFQEKLTHIGDTLKKVEKEIKSQPGDKPYIQEPGKPPKKI